MIKLVFMLRRAPHLSREEFQRYWRENHASLVAARADALGIRRYVQRHTVSEPMFEKMGEPRGGVADYDGIAELWWERPGRMTPEQVAAAREANRVLLEDEGRFIDLANSPVFFVDDNEVIPYRPTGDFEAFKAAKLAQGFDEVLVRNWDPGFENAPHAHPFDTDAIVAYGEYWLTIGEDVRHLKAGDAFQVPRGVVHSERYGPAGAVFWAARKN